MDTSVEVHFIELLRESKFIEILGKALFKKMKEELVKTKIHKEFVKICNNYNILCNDWKGYYDMVYYVLKKLKVVYDGYESHSNTIKTGFLVSMAAIGVASAFWVYSIVRSFTGEDGEKSYRTKTFQIGDTYYHNTKELKVLRGGRKNLELRRAFLNRIFREDLL